MRAMSLSQRNRDACTNEEPALNLRLPENPGPWYRAFRGIDRGAFPGVQAWSLGRSAKTCCGEAGPRGRLLRWISPAPRGSGRRTGS
jgi:hypothetical protein